MPDAGHAALSDDGSTIRLMAYSDDGAVVAVTLAPVRAIALADELIRAGLPKLAALEKTPARRGGDPSAVRRQRRDDDLRALHQMTGAGQSVERWARETVDRLARFQPMSEEPGPERRLMRKIKSADLPIGSRRIREILAKQ